MPLVDLLCREMTVSWTVLHSDNTLVSVLAPWTGKTRTGQLWTYVRSERPHSGRLSAGNRVLRLTLPPG